MATDLRLEPDDAPDAETPTPRHTQTIFERVGGDFEAGLNEAEKAMARYVRTKRAQDATAAAWDARIAKRRREIERLERGRDRACAKYQHDLDYAQSLIDGFMEAFASDLPRRTKTLRLPSGEFARRACRATTVKEPDAEVLPILRRLPYEAMEQAIENTQKANWAWVKAHLVETEDGPVIRWADPETGEIWKDPETGEEVPAVVEREAVGDEVATTPILRTVPPARPYVITITPATETPAEDDQEDEDADGPEH